MDQNLGRKERSMGFFNKIFGGRKEFPALDAANPAARRLDEMREPLESLMEDVNEPLEVVPVGPRPFVFMGNPPKRFGLAWVEAGQVKNLQTLVDEKGIAPDRMSRLVEQIRTAYEHSASDPRYQATVAGRQIVVAPSERLEEEVEEIIHSAEV
jgi:hypothetical protein